MEKISKNHVLSVEVQEENDKKAIRNIIESYDIEDALDIIYTVIGDVARTGGHVDAIINKLDKEIKESRKNIDDN